MSRMRIVIGSQTYRPPPNGQAVFAIHLAEGLVQAGHQVLVLMPSEQFQTYMTYHNGVQIGTVAAVPLLPFAPDVYVTPWPDIQVGHYLDQFRPQIVHIQDHYPLCRGIVRVAHHRHLPLIGTNHFLPDNMVPYLPGPIRERLPARHLLWRTVLSVFNRLDMATAPSATAVRILRQQGLHVPVQAISCGVDLARFGPDPQVDEIAVRARYGLDAQATVILYVGRVDREKRLDLLLQALHYLGRTDLQLAIAGRGEHLEILQALAAHLQIERQVVFTGYVPDADMPALLNSVDIFAMPSAAELQSIATLEAMATGRPVLAAHARALPELVLHHVNGFLFRAGDVADAARGLAELVDRRDDWPTMGMVSRTIAQTHDVRRTIQQYEQLYHELLAAKQALPGSTA